MPDRRSPAGVRRPSVNGVARSETGHNCGSLSSSARVSDPAETPDRRSPASQETFGQRRGSVRDRPQLRVSLKFGAGLRPRRNARPQVSGESGDLRSAAWLGQRPATTAGLSQVRRGSPTPPKRPTAGLPRVRRPSVSGVARSETGHNCGSLSSSARVSDPAEMPDRRSPRESADLRSTAWLGQRPATTAVGDRPQLRYKRRRAS